MKNIQLRINGAVEFTIELQDAITYEYILFDNFNETEEDIKHWRILLEEYHHE
jgi:hypothetical protein